MESGDAWACFVTRICSRTLRYHIAGSTASEFHTWRSYSLYLLAQERDELPEDAKGYISRKATHVMDFIKSWTNLEEKELLPQLERIFNKMIILSKLIRQQRAAWTLQYPSRSKSSVMPFDDSWAEDVQGDDESDTDSESGKRRAKTIELIVTPVVLKCGDAYGEMYDINSTMMKAQVLLSI